MSNKHENIRSNGQNPGSQPNQDYEGYDDALIHEERLESAVRSHNPVGIYFAEISQVPLLTPEEETALAAKIWQANQAFEKLVELGEITSEHMRLKMDGNPRNTEWSNAKKPELLSIAQAEISKKRNQELWSEIIDSVEPREHLCRANTRLVVSIAKKYIGQGLPFLDLIQFGNEGLLRAADKFDYTKKIRFSTYASWWIRQAITRSLAETSNTIRVPVHQYNHRGHIYREAAILEQELGRKPTVEEIAGYTGHKSEYVEKLIITGYEPLSLDMQVGRDEDATIAQFIPDPEAIMPDEIDDEAELSKLIEEVLLEFDPRTAQILSMRFGFRSHEPHTLEEVAAKLELSRERVRQLEKDALEQLKLPYYRRLFSQHKPN